MDWIWAGRRASTLEDILELELQYPGVECESNQAHTKEAAVHVTGDHFWISMTHLVPYICYL